MSDHFDVVAVSGEPKYLEKIARREGVRYAVVALTRKITPLKDLIAVYRLYKLLKKERPAIVHTHTPKAGIVGMLASYLAKVPYRLHTVAGLPLLEVKGMKRTVLNAVERLTYRCATRVYPNSFGLQEIIKVEGFAKDNKLHVIGSGSSNGIDTTYFDPQAYTEAVNKETKHTLGIPLDDFCFVFVGRLVTDKGINELISAFVNVNIKHADTSLVLVGPLEGDLDPLDRATLSQVEQHPKIFALGYQDDVRPCYAFAKALCFPSYREGFPNVVLQAGAMGLPSIVTDINGCNEIIAQGVNGLIIPPKDAVSLEEAMLAMLEDEPHRREMAAIARTEITRNYKRERVHKAMLEEYKRLLFQNS